MKKCTLILTLILLCGNCFATTYYVSNSGNDLNSGTSPDSAWQTIAKLNTVTFQPGDAILFASGETFRGQWVFSGNGSVGSSVYIGVYGGTAKAVISGSVVLVGWQPNGNSMYDIVFNQWCRKLIVNDVVQTLARYPKSGFLTVNGVNGNNSITCNALSGQSGAFFVNSNIRIRTANAYYETRQIDSMSTSTEGQLYFNNPTNTTPQTGFGFYLDNNPAYIDTAGEWYCDTVNHFIYYQPAAGVAINSVSSEASVMNYGILFDSSANYISINNISFMNQYISGINFLNNATGVIINNCSFVNQEMYGIYEATQISGSVIKNDSFTNINGNAIWANNIFGDSVSYNHFSSIGVHAGQGTSGYSSATAIFSPSATYSVFSYNRFDTTGYAAINVNGTGNVIERNIINYALYTLADGGAITNFGSGNSQSFYIQNFILNAFGNTQSCNIQQPLAYGIYLNNGAHNELINGNVIANTNGYGLYIVDSFYNNQVRNNLVYNSSLAQVNFFQSSGTPGVTQFGNRMAQNQFYGLNENETPYIISTLFGSVAIPSSDSNYFINPYLYASTRIYYYYSPGSFGQALSLHQWTEFSKQDSSSKASFINFSSYVVKDTTGSDLIENGNFTDNFDSWSAYPDSICQMLLDNSTVLDGGCVRINLLAPDTSGQLTSNGFEIIPGQFYQLNFSLLGSKSSSVETNLYGYGGSYLSNGIDRLYKVDTARQDIVNCFKAISSGYTNSFFKFQILSEDSIMWFDNVHLFPVSAVKNDSSRLMVLLLNETNNNRNYSFTDSSFLDKDGDTVRSITLTPWSAAVLFYNNNTALGVRNIQVNNSLRLYPNPASSYIMIAGTSLNNTNAELRIYDINGQLIYTAANYKSGNNIDVSTLPAGIYLAKLISRNNLSQAMFVKIN